MNQAISVVSRLAVGSFGVILIYGALFLYEDEQRKLQNKLEEWWIKLHDVAIGTTSRSAVFVRGIAEVTTKLFDKAWGPEIFSLRAVRVSLFCSATVYLVLMNSLPTLRSRLFVALVALLVWLDLRDTFPRPIRIIVRSALWLFWANLGVRR